MSAKKDPADVPLIIIKKRKYVPPVHHGGSWKVAYADFVTAMMAFFLILWMLNSVPKKHLEGLQAYFSPGIVNGDLRIRASSHSATEVKLSIPTMDKGQDFNQLSRLISNTIFDTPEMKELQENVLIQDTPEGLLINIVDSKKRSMFVQGSPKMQPFTKKILEKVAVIIRALPYYVAISGHTNSNPTNNREYDNWDLSSDRANTVRKYLYSQNVDIQQVTKVVGRADHDPLEKDDLSSPRNIRLSLLLLRNATVPYQLRSAR